MRDQYKHQFFLREAYKIAENKENTIGAVLTTYESLQEKRRFAVSSTNPLSEEELVKRIKDYIINLEKSTVYIPAIQNPFVLADSPLKRFVIHEEATERMKLPLDETVQFLESKDKEVVVYSGRVGNITHHLGGNIWNP